MKIVEVFKISQDTLHAMYDTGYVDEAISNWLNTDEGKFVTDHTIEPIKTVKEHRSSAPLIDDVATTVFAVFDEEVETFWRLKFK